jgi:hypothetical protein
VPEAPEEAIVITTQGLWLFGDEGWRTLRYEQIVRVNPPYDETKNLVSTLFLTLHDGEKEVLSIRGGNGNFRDAWPFLHFLIRVLGDVSETRGE